MEDINENVVCFLLDDSMTSEFYMPKFRNTLSVPSSWAVRCMCLWRWNRQSVPKLRHIKFRRWGITQKKAYNIQDMAKVWNQESMKIFDWTGE